MGKVGMPLRVAITGAGQSPSLDVTAHLIGKPAAWPAWTKPLILSPNAPLTDKSVLTGKQGLHRMRLALKGARLPIIGAIAQLGERLHGMQEVGGSIPLAPPNSGSRRFSALPEKRSAAKVARSFRLAPPNKDCGFIAVISSEKSNNSASPAKQVDRRFWGYSSAGERLHGMQEVGGSIPPSSTN